MSHKTRPNESQNIVPKQSHNSFQGTLPAWAGRPVNRCNLPTAVLGGLHYQSYPEPIAIDGVAELYGDLFRDLDAIDDAPARAQHFMDAMTVKFRLEWPEDAGGDETARVNADYLRLLRGWMFDADGREAAVIKAWVESRFGLLPRYHGAALGRYDNAAYDAYLRAYTEGLHGTNAVEGQLDLVYSYCQYELTRQHAGSHMTLYRGANRIEDFDVIEPPTAGQAVVLLNNLNSFTRSRDTAGMFGDYILTVRVPTAKVFYYADLLPHRMQGEGEVMVLGGVYRVDVSVI